MRSSNGPKPLGRLQWQRAMNAIDPHSRCLVCRRRPRHQSRTVPRCASFCGQDVRGLWAVRDLMHNNYAFIGTFRLSDTGPNDHTAGRGMGARERNRLRAVALMATGGRPSRKRRSARIEETLLLARTSWRGPRRARGASHCPLAVWSQLQGSVGGVGGSRSSRMGVGGPSLSSRRPAFPAPPC